MLKPQDILLKYWKYDTFRSLQSEIINSVLEGKDTLALLPTGGGKSVCFQVPAMVLDGMCIVITPLIALMKDQVDNLKSKDITAAYIDSSMSFKEIHILLDNAVCHAYKFLYISPERLQSDSFKERLKFFKINILVVDEAHCISQWGYDFRPSYLEIAKIRDQIGAAPIIALTATATEVVKQDICSKLEFKTNNIFQKSFARSNLSYSVFNEDDKIKKMFQILKGVLGSGIIYVKSRKRTKQIALMLSQNNIKADFYNAGLGHEDRAIKQENWVKNRSRIMVATNAFGMGIDKPDVRLVIHLDIPESLEAYYQEAGRAGRDEKKAYGVALFNNDDLKEIKQKLTVKYPEILLIKKVYQALANHFQVASGGIDSISYDFDQDLFCKKFNFEMQTTFFALQHLAKQGFITLNEIFFSSARLFVPDNKELYKFQVENVKFDAFIKAILRIFGGSLYSDFVKISVNTLARRLNTSTETVEIFLAQLHDAGVVVYEKLKDKPQIGFLSNRFNVENLPFNQKMYSEQKQKDLLKMQSVFDYMENTIRCRTKILLEYFGELSNQDCGVCDHCIQKIKSQKQNLLVDQLQSQVIKHITQQEMTLDELFTIVDISDKQLFTLIIKKLLDNQLIEYKSSGRLGQKFINI